MEGIQIEITNACLNQCSNCTRLIGHFEKPYFMDFDYFKQAVDSLENFPKMIGLMGGEPLLHPQFAEMCEYLHSKCPPDRCGLWSCFPESKVEHRNVIVKTFGNIFLNDHSRDDILHAPVLVSAKELCGDDINSMWYLIEHCWVQNFWSASINPHGAFFCEVAAALAMLFDKGQGWKVEPDWWEKIPKDFKTQMETYCPLCGCAMPLAKRSSTEEIDDISQDMLDMLIDSSPKLKRGEYILHTLQCALDIRTPATYKDERYRARIADKYGMFLMVNDKGYQTPYLRRNT